jgi:pimeloyl-ACP methyl ester carboxylesterase
MIPSVDFGGSGLLLHFAHANGYPPEAYRPLIETLTPHYHVYAMPFRPLWPDSTLNGLKDWTPFVDDLILFFRERGQTDVIGVGHSLGAVVSLAAALRQPDLFRALVVIDPVLFRRRRLWGMEVARRLGVLRRLHPLIGPTLRRRRMFAGADEMFSRYRRAPVFKHIDDHGLRAYINSMARPRPDGQVELSFSPEWEAKIYEVGPLNVWPALKNLRPPLLIIRGAKSDTFFPQTAKKVKQVLPGAIIHDIEGASHLVPLERPEETGRLIREFLDRIV